MNALCLPRWSIFQIFEGGKMTKFRTLLLAGAVAALGVVGTANAGLLDGSFQVTVYHGTNTGGEGNAMEQALPTNTLAQTNPIAAFTYTGNFNFNATQNNIYNFFSSGGGSLLFTTRSQSGLFNADF